MIPLLMLLLPDCKKITLEREPKAVIQSIDDIGTNNATAKGEVIDLGNGDISSYGFCYGTNAEPTINDQVVDNTTSPSLGVFSKNITGLSPSTIYYIRAFVKEDNNYYYSETEDFETQESGGQSFWLHYDDGTNHDGVGVTGGGSFDVAIYFPVSLLSEYSGYKITKYKFFPRNGDPVQYDITLWEGTENDLVFDINVGGIITGEWNTVSLSEPYYISGNTELKAGIWIYDQPEGVYPMGVDAGPAEAGFGDLLSFDDGETWFSMSEEYPSLDYNWNLQVYLTNESEKEVVLSSDSKVYKRKINDSKPRKGKSLSSYILSNQ